MSNHSSFNNHKRWEVKDVAFLRFCKFRGLKIKDSSLLLERTRAATAVMSGFITQFENNTHDPSDRVFVKIRQALQLEAKVRSGLYPDQLQYWLDRIARKNGITYKVLGADKPKEVVEEKVEEKPVISETETTEAIQPSAVEIKINLSADQLGQILQLLVGVK
jgi:hypothetical protein